MSADVNISSQKGFLLSQAEIAEIRELHAGQQYSFACLARMFRVEVYEVQIIVGKKRGKK